MSFDDQTIQEFRANGGQVGGFFEGKPLLLLHHMGARSGVERVTPLVYQKVDDGYAVFASKGGADENPAWYHNLMANPEVSIEVGSQTVAVVPGKPRPQSGKRSGLARWKPCRSSEITSARPPATTSPSSSWSPPPSWDCTGRWGCAREGRLRRDGCFK